MAKPFVWTGCKVKERMNSQMKGNSFVIKSPLLFNDIRNDGYLSHLLFFRYDRKSDVLLSLFFAYDHGERYLHWSLSYFLISRSLEHNSIGNFSNDADCLRSVANIEYLFHTFSILRPKINENRSDQNRWCKDQLHISSNDDHWERKVVAVSSFLNFVELCTIAFRFRWWRN